MKSNEYKVIAFSDVQEIHSEVSAADHANILLTEEAVCMAPAESWASARLIAGLLAKGGYYAYIADSFDGKKANAMDVVRPKPVPVVDVNPSFYVGVWNGSVKGTSEHHGQHVGIFDSRTNSLCALLGLVSDEQISQTLDNAFMFIQAPKMYDMILELLEAFAGQYKPGEHSTVDKAARLLNCFNGRQKYDAAPPPL